MLIVLFFITEIFMFIILKNIYISNNHDLLKIPFLSCPQFQFQTEDQIECPQFEKKKNLSTLLKMD